MSLVGRWGVQLRAVITIAPRQRTNDASRVHELGTVLPGGFRVEGMLGRGGVADVYAVTGPSGQPLALKMLHQHLAHDRVCVARFALEGDLLARIHDPHVVAYRSRGVWGRRPFIVMERARGVDLTTWLPERRVLDAPTAIAVGAGVLAGIATLHAHAIVHRDIKPANVFVHRYDERVEVQLIDLGSAVTVVDDDGAAGAAGQTSGHHDLDRLTPIGHTIVTPHYASPELLTGHWERDPRGDLYAAAVLVFQLLTGHLPFEHADMGELIRRIAHTPAPPLSVFNVQPQQLSGFMERALDFDSERRFADAQTMRVALLQCLAEARAESGPGRANDSR